MLSDTLNSSVITLGIAKKASLMTFEDRCSIADDLQHSIALTAVYAVCLMTFRAHYKSVERSVIWKGAREWNGLETGVRSIATKSHFKAVQKKWLLATLGQPIQ